MCSYHSGLFSPFGTNHTDISASICLSLATVYLQWHFSSFHCLLTLVILLYRLIKRSFSRTDLHTFSTHSICHFLSLCLLLSSSPSPTSFTLDFVIKECSLIGGMSSALYQDIRSQIPSVQETALIHYKNVLGGEAEDYV